MKNIRSESFKSLISSIQATERVLSPEQELVRQSLLKKLYLAKSRWDDQFSETETELRHPAMGLISIKHESLPSPVKLFGSDLSVVHQVRITVYHAAINKVSGAIVKGAVAAEFLMTETQFGEMMVSPNSGPGTPATLQKLYHDQEFAFDPESDPTKKTLGRLLDFTSRPCSQIDRFLDEIQSIVDVGVSAGKIGAKDLGEVIKLLNYSIGNLPSNTARNVDLVSEAVGKRIEEAMLNSHISVQQFSLNALEKKS